VGLVTHNSGEAISANIVRQNIIYQVVVSILDLKPKEYTESHDKSLVPSKRDEYLRILTHFVNFLCWY